MRAHLVLSFTLIACTDTPEARDTIFDSTSETAHMSIEATTAAAASKSRARSTTTCGAEASCECGSISGNGSCNGAEGGLACSHRCLPAACRSDADCGVGGWCSPSPSECGGRPERWACHYAGRDECLSDWECSRNGWNPLCRFVAGAWGCNGGGCIVE